MSTFVVSSSIVWLVLVLYVARLLVTQRRLDRAIADSSLSLAAKSSIGTPLELNLRPNGANRPMRTQSSC